MFFFFLRCNNIIRRSAGGTSNLSLMSHALLFNRVFYVLSECFFECANAFTVHIWRSCEFTPNLLKVTNHKCFAATPIYSLFCRQEPICLLFHHFELLWVIFSVNLCNARLFLSGVIYKIRIYNSIFENYTP